jgi:plastocyanin
MVKSILALVLLIPASQQPPTFAIGGTVKLEGPVSKPKINKALAADQACAACHEKIPFKDDLVVSEAGGVRWAFVYVKKGLEGKEFKPPATTVQLDQIGCLYTPHVVGIMVGQPLNIRNSDPMNHNVHALPFANKEFNFAQLPKTDRDVTFTVPEVMVKVKCDMHPWMGAWIGVVDHPFFAVTDADGKFEIKGLPAGTYTLGVWHEGLETLDDKNEIRIVVKEAVQVGFAMKQKKAS